MEQERPAGARLLLLVGALALLASLALGWDGGIRDLLSADEVAAARRGGILSAFEAGPSTPFELLVPFGLALLAVVALILTVAVRGASGRAEAVVLGGTLACVGSLLVRQLLDDAPGVADGTLLATGGLLVALPAATRLPRPRDGREPGWAVLALGLLAAALLTGMVHDAYAAVDLDEGVFGANGVGPGTGWPGRWLAAGVGSRTAVDIALVVVAVSGLLAAAVAAAGRLGRAAAVALAALAGLVALGLLVLALDPPTAVGGVDRFPIALAVLVALLAIAASALRATTVVPEPVADDPPDIPARAAAPPPSRIAPPEAWAHPSRRPHGWWS